MTIQIMVSIAINALTLIIVGGAVSIMYHHPPGKIDSRIIRTYLVRKRYELLKISLVIVLISIALRLGATIFDAITGSGTAQSTAILFSDVASVGIAIVLTRIHHLHQQTIANEDTISLL